MCGIIGLLDLEGQRTVDPETLSRMAAAVRHRGPDQARGWIAAGVGLATQRLAIRDVEHGQQPRSDPAGRVTVSFNGELFNDVALRDRLRQAGHALPGRCDTELWPALYLESREQAFTLARGQFATALWDADERRLLLGRDRVGICPLYFAVREGWLLWASEVKGLLASGLVRPEVDLEGIDQLLTTFAAPTRHTCFRGVQAVLPGHYLRATRGELEQVRYWDLDFPAAGEERVAQDEDALAEELLGRLRTATRSRLTADGEVGVYLSAGVDSTLLLGLGSAASARPMRAFTVGFEGAARDERQAAGEAARCFGAPHTTISLSDREVADALPAAVLAAEGPIMDTANACLARLAEAVSAAGFKVVLSGEGADEALAGYGWHKAAKLLASAPLGLGGLARGLAASLTTPGAPEVALGPALGGLRPSLLELYEPLARAKWRFYGEPLRAVADGRDPFSAVDVRPARMRDWAPLNQGLYLEYKLMLPGHLLLGKGDRVGMRSAVENRYPFLDEDVVELCATLAPRYKLRGSRDKWLLRRAAARALPRRLLERPKAMFKARPLCELAPPPRWVAQLMSASSLRATGYFCEASLRHEEALQRALPSWAPRRFVTDGTYTAVVATQLWHHTFLGGGLCELPTWKPPPPSDLPIVRGAE